MNEIIERVARAIADDEGFCAIDKCAPDICHCRRLARAAIAAMRDPTLAMIADANRNNHPRDVDTWRTMIDAALKDQD